MKDENIIFIGGIARSGTTLFQNILDSHPDILGLPEFRNTPRIIKLRNQMKDEIKEGFIDLICNEQELDTLFKNFIFSFFSPLMKKYKCNFISEKTPQNLVVFEDLIKLFPKSGFVLTIRDPRAIVSSTKKVVRRARRKLIQSGVGNFDEILFRIKEEYKLTILLKEKYKDRIFLVKYDDLVNDTERVTKEFCKYMSIPWYAEMIRPGDKHHINEKGMTTGSNQAFYSEKMFNRNPDNSSLFAWESDLTKSELYNIYWSFKKEKLHNHFGYNLNKVSLNIFEAFSSFIKALFDKMVRIFYILLRFSKKFSRI